MRLAVFVLVFALTMYLIGLCEVWSWPFERFCAQLFK
jgi:hypothetical protein